MTLVRYERNSNATPKLTPAQKKRLDAMADEDIDYSDIPDIAESMLGRPQKKQLTIRLDHDVLTWLKANGKGYQTRINVILRAVMESKSRLVRRKAVSTKKRAAT